ncbi:MAG: lactoylglutathione lyase [Candidatus Tokpelaia sp.]|nr:MAG: lactoylglutathione lyase [Candidatus Tokpelaia sp.]KAA6207665.1 MAG: lactoylglutathione lyase [Candidatus Tokpelaia sp.]
MRYLHTMVRVSNLEKSLQFYTEVFGLVETHRLENEKGRFTLVYLAAPADKTAARAQKAPELELTWNWDKEIYTGGRNFGHLAYEVENIYTTCRSLMDKGIMINRPPRDGHMAFIKSPDGISIELLQKGGPLEPKEPWASMENSGSW